MYIKLQHQTILKLICKNSKFAVCLYCYLAKLRLYMFYSSEDKNLNDYLMLLFKTKDITEQIT